MRSVRIVLAGAFLVAMLSGASCQQASDTRVTAEAAIRAADAAGLKAAQAKDVAGATANYADDASWLPPHAPWCKAKKRFEAHGLNF